MVASSDRDNGGSGGNGVESVGVEIFNEHNLEGDRCRGVARLLAHTLCVSVADPLLGDALLFLGDALLREVGVVLLRVVVRKTVRVARQLTTMQPRKRRAVGARLRKWAGTSVDEILEATMSVARERPHEQARGAGAAVGRERVTRRTTEAPAPQTEDAVSTLLSAAAFAVARHIQTLGGGEGAATLEMDCPRAPTVCPCVNGGQCTLGRAGTVLGDHYTDAVAGLEGPVADGWAGALGGPLVSWITPAYAERPSPPASGAISTSGRRRWERRMTSRQKRDRAWRRHTSWLMRTPFRRKRGIGLC